MKHLISIILFLLLQTLFVSGQTNTSTQQSYYKIDSLFNAHYKSNRTGAAFAIIKDGETIYKNAMGLANVEYNIPITDSTAFCIASISKQFTTYLALQLELEGKLSFSDDVKIYLPELSHLPNKITLKDLMNHTHGLPNSYELAHLKEILPHGKMNHHQALNMLLNIKQTNFNVGDQYEYSNTGYMLLAEIIERIGKKPFKEQLKKKIFLPLGMNNSQAVDDVNTVIRNKAYSYRFVNNEYENQSIKLSAIGSSGISATINDMILWAKNYQNPTIGKRSFYNEMQKATILNSGQKINYGLGLQSGIYKGLDIVFHGGGTESYRSYILHIPKHHLSMVILANSGDFSALDIIYQTIDILLENDIKTKKLTKVKSNHNQLNKHEGTYEWHPGVYFNIIAINDSLYFQNFGSENLDLLPQLDKNTFEFPYIRYSNFTFHEGKIDFRISDFTYECFKTDIQQLNPDELNLNSFTGIFRNKEHKITHELIVVDNQLHLKRVFGNDIILNPINSNSFYSAGFGKLDFVNDSNGLVKGYKFSGQNIKNMVFNK